MLPALAAAAAAACTGKSAARPDSTRGATAAGADSASANVVMKSAPPTVQDRSIAVPDSAGSADTNRSGMAVRVGGAPKESKDSN